MKHAPAPVVTVGLSVSGWNVSLFSAAVRSVFAQTLTSWELVIVLDGTSNELSACARAISDERVRVENHVKCGGLALSLNEIASAARAPLLARMDGDDIMFPQRLERQSAYLDAHPEVDVLGSHAITIDDQTCIRGALPESRLPNNRSGFLTSHVLSHPTIMMRTIWARQHPYDPKYLRGEDKELWFRAQPETMYAKLNEQLMFYRITRDPDVKKQQVSARYDRRFLCDVGPQSVGRFSTLQRVAGSYVKQAIYSAAAFAHQNDLLYRRHFTELPATELNAAVQALSVATSTPVPGWE